MELTLLHFNLIIELYKLQVNGQWNLLFLDWVFGPKKRPLSNNDHKLLGDKCGPVLVNLPARL